MRLLSLIVCLLALVARGPAQPRDIFTHLAWKVQGDHRNQSLGMNGLDTIGYLNDTIRHALAVGSDGRSKLIFNRFPGDTAAQFWFPGEKVIRGNINGDAFPDFVVVSTGDRRITVLFGTKGPAQFDTALTLQGDRDANDFHSVSVVVTRCDSDRFDDIVVSDLLHEDFRGREVGRLLYFRGGQQLDSLPTENLEGTEADEIGGTLAVGKLRDSGHSYLVEARLYWMIDTSILLLHPLTNTEFHLASPDTIVLRTVSGGAISGGFLLADMEGNDNVDDIAVCTSSRVLVYKGGASIGRDPTFVFSKPYSTGSTTFGGSITDLGDITGRGYHTLAVTDVQASVGGLQNGAVFLYNIGSALRDSCVAVGSGRSGDEDAFGSEVVSLGDVTGDGRADFLISGSPGLYNEGGLYMFTGDSSYGPLTGIQDGGTIAPTLALEQNFPDPCVDRTQFTFSADRCAVMLALYDVVGREVAVVYHGVGDGRRHVLPFNTAGLPAGTYSVRLTANGRQVVRNLTVIR